MDIQKVRFANLNVNFDADKIKQEVDILKDRMFDVVVHSTHLADQNKIPIFSEEVLQNASYYDLETNQTIHKRHEAWKGVSLTHIGYSSDTIRGTMRSRALNVNNSWEWREDINTPYIKSIVDQFNFEVLHLVKIIVLPPDGVGLVHKDDSGNYYNNGCFSVTLNVSNGGSPLVFLENDKIFEVWPKQSHIFRDDCYHAIPITASERITIRINGRPNIDTIKRLIESDSAMYV